MVESSQVVGTNRRIRARHHSRISSRYVFEGVVIGKAGLWRANEIGFIFSRSVWGTGIASEAVRAIMSRASTRGVTSIIADVDPRNERCLRLLEKLGFVQTGAAKHTVLVGDEWADSVYLEAKV